jgi:hypothetical protein
MRSSARSRLVMTIWRAVPLVLHHPHIGEFMEAARGTFDGGSKALDLLLGVQLR